MIRKMANGRFLSFTVRNCGGADPRRLPPLLPKLPPCCPPAHLPLRPPLPSLLLPCSHLLPRLCPSFPSSYLSCVGSPLRTYRAGRLQVRSTLNLPFSPPLRPFDLPFECKSGSALAMLGLDGKPLFVSSWWSKCYFKSSPVKQEIGAGTGDFDFLIKFPTRTENLRKGSAEGTREGPLGGTLEVFIAGLG